MKNLLKDFVNILYPATCPGCSKVFARGEENLCLSCEIDLPVFRNEQITEHILGGRVPVQAAAIYLKFYAGGLTQHLLHEVKYRGNRRLGEYLGERLILQSDTKALFDHVDIIVPIPLHEEKLRQRGYNQSELIARGMAKILAKPVDAKTVTRILKNQTQTRKSREQRWQNVEGIFACHDEVLRGMHVLLVDDVITTGATMEACAAALLEAGAASISFAALATAMK